MIEAIIASALLADKESQMKSDKPVGFFKPEDFMVDLLTYKEDISVSQIIANIANAKLEREGKVVYKEKDPVNVWCEVTWPALNHAYKALLINIEPIEKCTHPKEKVHRKWDLSSQMPIFWHECDCGAKVQPKEFEVVE